MKRKRVVILPGEDGTRERAIQIRRDLIAHVVSVDSQAAAGLPVSPATVDLRAGWIRSIRRIERDWKLKPWSPQTAMASLERQAVEQAPWPADFVGDLITAGRRPARTISVVDRDRRMLVHVEGIRAPLLPLLVAWSMDLSRFYDAIQHAFGLGDTGHDIGGALITESGQAAGGLAPRPVGKDAFLFYCRNCRRAAWLNPPPGLTPDMTRSLYYNLDGPCAYPSGDRDPAANA